MGAAKNKRGSSPKKGAPLDDETVARIRQSIAEWEPGLWADRVAYGPACRCGFPPRALWINAKVPTKTEEAVYTCARHPDKTQGN